MWHTIIVKALRKNEKKKKNRRYTAVSISKTFEKYPSVALANTIENMKNTYGSHSQPYVRF